MCVHIFTQKWKYSIALSFSVRMSLLCLTLLVWALLASLLFAHPYGASLIITPVSSQLHSEFLFALILLSRQPCILIYCHYCFLWHSLCFITYIPGFAEFKSSTWSTFICLYSKVDWTVQSCVTELAKGKFLVPEGWRECDTEAFLWLWAQCWQWLYRSTRKVSGHRSTEQPLVLRGAASVLDWAEGHFTEGPWRPPGGTRRLNFRASLGDSIEQSAVRVMG